MLNKCKALPLIVTFLLLSTVAFADETISLKVGYQLLSPEGSSATIMEDAGTTIDLLSLDDNKNVTAEVALKWGDSQFTLNYLPINFSGTNTLSAETIFNGETYLSGETVNSDLDIEVYDIGYTYYLLNFDDLPTRFQLGIELAVKVADIDISLSNLDQSSESVTALNPTLGLRTRIALADFIGIAGRIGYLDYDDNHFLDAEAQIEFSPIPMIGIYAGYRYFDLKIDRDDVFVETKFSGPFGGLLVRF